MIITDMVGMPVIWDDQLCVIRAMREHGPEDVLVEHGDGFTWVSMDSIAPAFTRIVGRQHIEQCFDVSPGVKFFHRVWYNFVNRFDPKSDDLTEAYTKATDEVLAEVRKEQ